MTFIYDVATMQQATFDKIKWFVLDHMQWSHDENTMHISSGDYIIKVQIIKKHDSSDNFEEWLQKCPQCNQNTSLLKTSFTANMYSWLYKAYTRCKKNSTGIVDITKIWLTNSEYSVFNKIIKFGLAYKDKGMTKGIYGLPLQRICEFVNNERAIAEYYLTDPTKDKTDPTKRVMSDTRLYVHQIPKVQEIMEKTAGAMTTYYQNPAFTSSHDSTWQQ